LLPPPSPLVPTEPPIANRHTFFLHGIVHIDWFIASFERFTMHIATRRAAILRNERRIARTRTFAAAAIAARTNRTTDREPTHVFLRDTRT
jgi:hypothetical protein